MRKATQVTENMAATRSLLASNLARYAKEAATSFNAVALEAGISRAHLHEVLHGRASCSIDWLTTLAQVLDVAPGDLLREAPPV